MPVFRNIFACSSQDTTDQEKEELKREIDRLSTRMELIERDFAMTVRQIEQKIDTKLSILESKIDSLVMLLQTRHFN